MELIEQYETQKECDYKDEHYLVRDNGAVLRVSKEGKSARPLDNQWTFGSKDKATGYMTISSHRVHIIVASAFHGERDSKKYVVDHIDTNRCNNRPENLRWLTRLENILLNPITKSKIEYICGSVENFLENPSLLRGHEHEDNNFAWMRTVTKEEAENTLAHWKLLINTTRPKSSSGAVGDWIYKPTSRFIAKTPEEIDNENRIKAEQEEARRVEKEKLKAEAAERRREEARQRRIENDHQKRRIEDLITSFSSEHGWEIRRKVKSEGWKADILISKGDEKIAIKILDSSIRLRQELSEMEKEGIRGLFLSDTSNNYGNTFPMFEVSSNEGAMTVFLSSHKKVDLPIFLDSFCNHRLKPRGTFYASSIKVQFMETDCYKCEAPFFAYYVKGVFDGDEYYEDSNIDVFDSIVIRNVKKFVSENPALGYRLGEIKETVSRITGEETLSFACPDCGAVMGPFYLNELVLDYMYDDDNDTRTIKLDEKIQVETNQLYIQSE